MKNQDTQIISPADLDWWHWLAAMFPRHFTSEFAPHHHELWQWLWNIQLGDAPEPGACIAIWPRAAGKSTKRRSRLRLLCRSPNPRMDSLTSWLIQ